ncbi:MAG: hypothetical protein ACTS6G_04210 [Candidatus Hodgkinia cicadicola]
MIFAPFGGNWSAVPCLRSPPRWNVNLFTSTELTRSFESFGLRNRSQRCFWTSWTARRLFAPMTAASLQQSAEHVRSCRRKLKRRRSQRNVRFAHPCAPKQSIGIT